jgi:ParB family chromosome partitioning protein
MAKNSIDVYGASGKTNVLNFEPENLHLVTDKTHPLYDERIHLPINEAMVLNIMEQGVLEPIIVWKDPESGLACVVDGRQRVRHTLEANKRLVKQGDSPLLVPAVTKRGSAVRWLRQWSAQTKSARPIHRWAEQRKWLMRWSAGTTRTI